MTGFASLIRHMHPFIPGDDDDPTEMHLLRVSYLERFPCPAPPLYGRELQVRMRRLVFYLREEDADYLMAFRLVAERLGYRPAPPPAPAASASSLQLPQGDAAPAASNAAPTAGPGPAPQPAPPRPQHRPQYNVDEQVYRLPQPQLQPPALPPKRPAMPASAPATPAPMPSLPPRRDAAATPPQLPSRPPTAGARSPAATAAGAPPQPAAAEVLAGIVRELVAMGFNQDEVRAALDDVQRGSGGAAAFRTVEQGVDAVLAAVLRRQEQREALRQLDQAASPPPTPREPLGAEPSRSAGSSLALTPAAHDAGEASREGVDAPRRPRAATAITELAGGSASASLTIGGASAPDGHTDAAADGDRPRAGTVAGGDAPAPLTTTSISPARSGTTTPADTEGRSRASSVTTGAGDAVPATPPPRPSASLSPKPATPSPARPTGDAAARTRAATISTADLAGTASDDSSLASATDAGAYKTFSCMIDINGPTLHIYPRGFLRPLVSVHFSKLMVVGHLTVALPVFALRPNVQVRSRASTQTSADGTAAAPREGTDWTSFPTMPNDFVYAGISEGNGREATKLEIFIFPSTVHLLGERAPPDPSATFGDSAEPPTGSGDGGDAHAPPLVAIGETRIGIHWDDTGTPQLVFSLLCPTVEYVRPRRHRKGCGAGVLTRCSGMVVSCQHSVNVPQDMLHLLYLTAAEYTRAGLPDFWLSNSERGVDFQWTDLLAYLPNPTNQPLPDRFTGYTVLHLLPSCGAAQAVGSPEWMQRANEDAGGVLRRSALESRCSYAVGVLFERITVTLLEGPTVVSQVRQPRVEQSTVPPLLTTA